VDTDFGEATRLILKALAAPGVSEIQSESGQRIRVKRDPGPGIELRLTPVEPAEYASPWSVLSVRAVDARPDLYPTSLPFVPGVCALILEMGDHITAAWRTSKAASCPAPSVEPDAELQALFEKLKSIREEHRPTDAASRAEAGEKVKAAIEALDPGSRAKLEELSVAMRPEPAVAEEAERIFGVLSEASAKDGWHVIEKQETETPVRTLGVRLERGSLSRRINMMAMFGPGSSVILMQGPRDEDG